MRLDAFPGGPARLVIATAIATLLVASGRSEGQQPGDEADQVRDGCASVVLVRCGPAQARSGEADATADSEESARHRLQARRLQRMQAQAGLNAIEITGERTHVQSDAWESFRQSVARAAVPDCLSPDTYPAEQWGLLRPLVLLGAAAAGKCR